jgi:hypothetical protein
MTGFSRQSPIERLKSAAWELVIKGEWNRLVVEGTTVLTSKMSGCR